MADVTGPISTLPGTRHPAPHGAICDNHGDRAAVARMQGETDSMGSEMHDLCEECRSQFSKDMQDHAHTDGVCDWCHQPATDLRLRRDFEEGSSGRLYDVCGDCVRKENESVALEAEESWSNGGWDHLAYD